MDSAEDRYIEALIAIEPEEFGSLWSRDLAYSSLAQLSQYLQYVHDEGHPQALAWLQRVLEVSEHHYVHHPDCRNLILVGLFESLQTGAYSNVAFSKSVDRFLGPQTAVAYADLIEGWTGSGVRTVEAWRCIISNSRFSQVTLRDVRPGGKTFDYTRTEAGRFDLVVSPSESEHPPTDISRTLTEAESVALHRYFYPWTAEQVRLKTEARRRIKLALGKTVVEIAFERSDEVWCVYPFAKTGKYYVRRRNRTSPWRYLIDDGWQRFVQG